ncbi:hypothetical protein ACWDUL_20545 [Nocardia niigatensis]
MPISIVEPPQRRPEGDRMDEKLLGTSIGRFVSEILARYGSLDTFLMHLR